MKPVVRIFDSGDHARDAAEKLRAAGFETDSIFVMAPPAAPVSAFDSVERDDGSEVEEAPAAAQATASPPSMSAAELVERVRPAGDLSITKALVCTRALDNGKALIVVGAHYGSGLRAEAIMDSSGALP